MSALAPLLRQSPVVILGETHQQPESPRLVADVVTAYLDAGGCLTVALEIASDQQAALEAGVLGEKPLSEIVIHPIIDHPAYRDMLGRLRDLYRAGKCLKVHAVDTPEDHPGPRDAWIAEEIHKLSTNGSVMFLVGNLHALKRIRWESGKDDAYLAERLVRQGIPVVSVLQEWDPGCQVRESRLLDARHPRAAATLQSTLDILAVHPVERPEEVVDHVLMWECTDS